MRGALHLDHVMNLEQKEYPTAGQFAADEYAKLKQPFYLFPEKEQGNGACRKKPKMRLRQYPRNIQKKPFRSFGMLKFAGKMDKSEFGR